MKIPQARLAQVLTKGLSHFYFITGDDPLLVDEARQAVLDKAKALAFTEREFYQVESSFDWAKLTGAVYTRSIFSARSIIEIRFPELRFPDTAKEMLTRLAEKPVSDKLIVVTTGKLDSKISATKWFKKIEEHATIVQVWPISFEQLPQWTRQRLQKVGLSAEPDAVTLLVERTEGNLLALAQEIEKLNLLYPKQTLTRVMVQEALQNSARYTVFELADACLQTDSARVLRMLNGLQAEGVEALIVLWSLTRILRILIQINLQLNAGKDLHAIYSQLGIWDKQKPLFGKAYARYSSVEWLELLNDAYTIDRLAKSGGKTEVWRALAQLALAIMAKPLWNCRD